tara:strand:+ start:317 stop:505 length:189 start_codon:yes stop_codon:yes gene_type:complete
MKKLFTSDNYLTGFLVFATAFALYFLITTNNLWKYTLWLPVMVVGFSAIGYVVNKAIEKLSK